MGFPVAYVEIDPFNGPLTANASNSYLEQSAYNTGFTITRGRSNELGRIEAGRADIPLDNPDRWYSESSGLGGFGLRPMRKVRIRCTYGATTYYLFTGYLEDMQFSYRRALDADVVWRCVDAFKYFASVKLNGAYTNENTKWSIDTWLTNIDWPAADRQLFLGASSVQAGTFVNTPALTHFRNAEAAESGLFFIDGQGRPTFHDRYYRLTNSLTSAATFGDDLAGAELPLLTFGVAWGDQFIWNEARITRTGGVEQVAEDTTSQADYFTRTYTATLPMADDNEALGLAQYFVSRYKEPSFRFTHVVLDGLMDDDLWPYMLGLNIGDRITVRSRVIGFQAVTDPTQVVEQDCYIEGIRHDVTFDPISWRTTFQLSPVDALQYWILENATYGILDSTTRLGY